MPDEPELSQEELDELDELEEEPFKFDDRRKLMVPVIGGVVVAVVAGWLFLGGGMDMFKGDTAADSLETTEALFDSALNDTSGIESADGKSGNSNMDELREKINGLAKKKEESIDLAEQITEAEKSEYDTLLGAAIDEFYMLLNAEISEEETKLLSDSAFTMMLFSSLEASPYIPVPRRLEKEKPIQYGVVQPTEQPVQMVDTTMYTALYTALVDSLKRELYQTRSKVDEMQTQNRRMQRKIDRNAKVSDSLYAAELKRLAKIIESMNPIDAAKMLSDKSSEDLSMVLFKVKPRQAAKILEAFPPKISAEVAAEILRD